MDQELHGAVGARLAAIEQRYTRGRRQLVEALADSPRPLTAAELVAARPALPQSTAYRNLAVLAQAGVVHRVEGTDEFARYELAEAVTGQHHHHLVCRVCGRVEDFAVPSGLERSVDTLMTQIGTDRGFRAESHRLDVLGTCATCTA
ncbi:MAG TPA: transcriptional repressor [Acidimicrobiales bacterium]|nr:transcriptional repressor [Acidimicrobiales bacterium]